MTISGKEANVPVVGIVAATNYQAAKDPALVKEEPYNDGWLMVVEPVDIKKNLKELIHFLYFILRMRKFLHIRELTFSSQMRGGGFSGARSP